MPIVYSFKRKMLSTCSRARSQQKEVKIKRIALDASAIQRCDNNPKVIAKKFAATEHVVSTTLSTFATASMLQLEII